MILEAIGPYFIGAVALALVWLHGYYRGYKSCSLKWGSYLSRATYVDQAAGQWGLKRKLNETDEELRNRILESVSVINDGVLHPSLVDIGQKPLPRMGKCDCGGGDSNIHRRECALARYSR